MFDAEQSIAEWRRQMLAAGLTTPSPLDELESHLREDVERQVRSGVSAEQAFDNAVARMGQAGALKTEFAKTRGFSRGLRGIKSTRTNRTLAVLWLAGCCWSFYNSLPSFDRSDPAGSPPDVFLSLLNMQVVFIYAAGSIGSIFLFRGAKWGRSIVGMLALLMTIVCVVQVLNFRMPAGWRVWCGFVAVFSLVSIWLLHSPEVANANPNTAAQ